MTAFGMGEGVDMIYLKGCRELSSSADDGQPLQS
jgi:hypothetical protein